MILRLLLLVVLWATILPVQAQLATPDAPAKTVVIDKRKLLVQPRNADGTVIVTPFLQDPVLWMRNQQQDFYQRMSKSIRDMRSTSSNKAAWSLFWISFLYGILHAAGPGHGKAVISGWLLATGSELKRGIIISFMSAMFQALTAIIIVCALLLFVSGASAMARDVAGFLESASYAMIGGMGLYLVWTSLRRAVPAVASAPVMSYQQHQGQSFELVSRPNANVVYHHIHHENCGCGHAHAPSAVEVRGDWSWRKAFALAFAVGIRPCSGAILVLIFSYSLGLFWAGVASTLAMGFGVFLTISTIASLAVFAKSTALKFTVADNPWVARLAKIGKISIGLAIAAFGLLLFLSSLGGINAGM